MARRYLIVVKNFDGNILFFKVKEFKIRDLLIYFFDEKTKTWRYFPIQNIQIEELRDEKEVLKNGDNQ